MSNTLEHRARIVIADDELMARRLMRHFLAQWDHYEIVGEAEDGMAAVDLVRTEKPDVVLMDVVMPRLNGIEATRRITDEWPRTKVVIVSVCEDEVEMARALEAGAMAFVGKSSTPDVLEHALRTVIAGDPYVPEHLMPKMWAAAREASQTHLPINRLTRRQHEVLSMVVGGYSTREIAGQLRISVKTVEVHRRNIMRCLNIHRIADLVRFALAHGLVDNAGRSLLPRYGKRQPRAVTIPPPPTLPG